MSEHVKWYFWFVSDEERKGIEYFDSNKNISFLYFDRFLFLNGAPALLETLTPVACNNYSDDDNSNNYDDCDNNNVEKSKWSTSLIWILFL